MAELKVTPLRLCAPHIEVKLNKGVTVAEQAGSVDEATFATRHCNYVTHLPHVKGLLSYTKKSRAVPFSR